MQSWCHPTCSLTYQGIQACILTIWGGGRHRYLRLPKAAVLKKLDMNHRRKQWDQSVGILFSTCSTSSWNEITCVLAKITTQKQLFPRPRKRFAPSPLSCVPFDTLAYILKCVASVFERTERCRSNL